MRKRLLSLLLAGIMALTLIGCGGKSSDSASNASDGSGAEVSAAAESAQPAEAAQPGVKPDGWTEADATEKITYLMAADIASLDHIAGGNTNLSIRAIKYCLSDPLFKYDDEGNVQGWLVETWDMADDYMSCLLHMRHEVYFNNGQELKAEDVKFSFDRILTDELITAERDWRPNLDSVEVVDDYTVKLNFKNPMPSFYARGATPETDILCKSAYESMGHDAYWANPVMTGAYVVKEYDQPNSHLTLQIRDDEHGYWGYKAFGTYTNVKEIEFAYSPEGETRVSALRAGDADFIDIVPVEDVDILQSEGFNVLSTNGTTVVYFACQQEPSNPLSSKELRQALSLAVDRKTIVDTLLGGSGVAATWPSRQGDYGWIDGVSENGYRYDPEEAKKLVAESGYDGRPLTLVFSTAVVNIGVELSQALQSMWKEVGINVEIEMLENAIFQERTESGDYDIRLNTLIGITRMWLNQVNSAVKNDRWQSHYDLPELKSIGEEIMSNCDPDILHDLFERAYVLEVEYMTPDINLYFPQNYAASSSRLTGIEWHSQDTPDLSAVFY